MLFIQKSWEIIESKVDSSSSTWFHGNTQITDDDEGRIMGRITGRTLRSSHCVFSVTSGSLTQCWEFFSCLWIDTLWNKWFLKPLVFLMCVSLSESLVLEGWWKEQGEGTETERERDFPLHQHTACPFGRYTATLLVCECVFVCSLCNCGCRGRQGDWFWSLLVCVGEVSVSIIMVIKQLWHFFDLQIQTVSLQDVCVSVQHGNITGLLQKCSHVCRHETKGFFFFLFQRGSNNFSGITFPAASPPHKNCQLRVIPSKQLPVKAL